MKQSTLSDKKRWTILESVKSNEEKHRSCKDVYSYLHKHGTYYDYSDMSLRFNDLCIMGLVSKHKLKKNRNLYSLTEKWSLVKNRSEMETYKFLITIERYESKNRKKQEDDKKRLEQQYEEKAQLIEEQTPIEAYSETKEPTNIILSIIDRIRNFLSL